MLSRKKQLVINLMVTAFFVTASVGVGYATNSGGSPNKPSNGDYTGSYASGTGDAKDADVKIDSDVAGNVHGGYNAGSGNAVNNKVTIESGIIAKNVSGGHAEGTSDAESNHLTISGGEIQKNVYGGWSEAGNVNENSVTISGGEIKKDVYGGYSYENDVNKNSVTISSGKAEQDVYGGYTNQGNADNNKVEISGGEIKKDVYGGSGANNATENSVSISGGTIDKNVHGGYSIQGNATDNSVSISGGTITENVHGGSSDYGNATGNSVTISDGTIGGLIYGGYSDDGGTGNVTGNSVTISGGTVNAVVTGGYSGGSDDASGNSVTISGGTINVIGVYGGSSNKGDAINNTIIIKGNPTFGNNATLYGGAASEFTASTDVLTGNKLEVYRHTTNANGTHAVKGVENFEKMNFYLGNDTKNGDIMLQVTENVKLDKTDVGVDIATGEKPNLVVGDKVTLIASNVAVATPPKSQTVYAGLEKIYGLDFFREEKALGVTVNKVKDNSKVQAIPVAQMTGQSMLRMGGDTIAMQGMTSALTAIKIEQVENLNDGEGGMPNLSTEKSFLNKGAVFATIGGGTSKYKTGGTSDVNSYNILTGMAWRINQPKNNNLILGAFFESGWGNYTTHNSYADGNVRGDGSSDYMGGGILGRYEFASGTYVEGSVRMGQVKNDYHSDDLRGAGYGRVGYNTSDTYTGAHLGLGYIKKINEQTELDLYGKYLYTHQDGSSVTMVGDNISFDPTNSHRLRLGARLAQKTTKDFNGYVGLAYEYEFDGKMGSSINHNPILAPSVKGSSGILELGVIFKPTNNKNLSLDLSVNGYAGKREGVSGNLQLKYLF